jgi:hypothetical protein
LPCGITIKKHRLEKRRTPAIASFVKPSAGSVERGRSEKAGNRSHPGQDARLAP